MSLIRFFIFFNILFCYYSHDPIMMGLAGSYNTSARGYNCVGVNPANLAFDNDSSIGLFGMSLNLSNNLFNQHRLNDISGAYLNDSKKEQIIGYLNEGPIKINSFFNMPFLMNFSFNKMAFTSNIKYLSEFELSQDFLKLILNGNSNIGEELGYELSMNNDFAIIWESSFTKAFDLEPFGLGFTIKYLKGLSYYNLEPTQNPYFYTNFTDITSKSTYIMKENSGGEGFAFDFGLTTKRTKSGWKFGASIINFWGHIKWNKSGSTNPISIYNNNESYIINLSINDLNMQNLNSFETDEIFRVDANTVYEVDVLPDDIANDGIEGSDYYCSDEDCNSYYINSDDYKVDDIVLTKNSILSMEYPTSLSLGFSKQLNENKLITFDFLTGFDTSWNNIQKWRFSTGYIFGTYKKPLRLGLSYGGYDYKSIGFSFGFKGKEDKFNIDFGLSLTDSYNVSKTSGFDYGINMYWLNQKQ